MKVTKNLFMVLAIAIAISIPAFASGRVSNNGNGTAEDVHTACGLGTHTVGVKRLYDGVNTYGYSYVNPVNNVPCYTVLKIGDASFKRATGVGYAQSEQKSRNASFIVSEEHGVWK